MRPDQRPLPGRRAARSASALGLLLLASLATAAEPLQLAPGSRERLGLETAVLAAGAWREQVPALAIAMDTSPWRMQLAARDGAAAACHAAVRQRDRLRGLAGGPGGSAAQELEAAELLAEQACIQHAALRQQLQAQWGGPLTGPQADRHAQAIAAGTESLLRIEPLQTLAATPDWSALQLADAGQRVLAGWRAPAATAARNGPSGFVLVAGPAWQAGQRAASTLPGAEAALAGVVVPAAAVVESEGQAWVFLDLGGERYARQRLDRGHPVDGGYLQTQGFAAGDTVVVGGATLLLAAQSGRVDEDE